MPPKLSKKCTPVSKSDEENKLHMVADDTILEDIKMKLDKLSVLDRIDERLSGIENDLSNIKGNVTELENGWISVNRNVAEMKEEMEKKVEKEKLQNLEAADEELRNRSRRNNLVFYNIPE